MLRVTHTKEMEQFQDKIARLFPLKNVYDYTPDDLSSRLTRTITFQVTDACNLACSYCYQINKKTRKMSFETAKKFFEVVLDPVKNGGYIDPKQSPGLIVEFIGGEPFLEVDLIDKVTDYILSRLIELNHPWATKLMFSICSNGVLYRSEKVQKYLFKNKSRISFSVTIDGDKELHDTCRRFPNGDPSYDIAIDAVKDWTNKGGFMGSKITISPDNVSQLSRAIKFMISDLHYYSIHANCVYEKGWEPCHATELYYQMKNIANYLLDQDLDKKVDIALFESDGFSPLPDSDNKNWCGGTGVMISCDPDGFIYPCIRYMESSIGDDQVPYRIGDVDNGIGTKYEEIDRIKCMKCITRRSQSTDECYNCPIASRCSWCSAYNYQIHGTPNKRATYICIMHKARTLANVYYWNKYFRKYNMKYRFENFCPKDWALEIIPEDEFDMLDHLAKEMEYYETSNQ